MQLIRNDAVAAWEPSLLPPGRPIRERPQGQEVPSPWRHTYSAGANIVSKGDHIMFLYDDCGAESECDGDWLPRHALKVTPQSAVDSIGSVDSLVSPLRGLSGLRWAMSASCPLTRVYWDEASPSRQVGRSVVEAVLIGSAQQTPRDRPDVFMSSEVQCRVVEVLARFIHAAHSRPHFMFAFAWSFEGSGASQLEYSRWIGRERAVLELGHAFRPGTESILSLSQSSLARRR